MARERIVIDTNVFISGLLFNSSVPAKAVERAVAHGLVLASHETVNELVTKFLSPKFDSYVSRQLREALLDRLAPNLEMVEIVQHVSASRDSTDDKFLDVAVNGDAHFVVTGDGDLLALHPFRHIDIVTPADYLLRPPRE